MKKLHLLSLLFFALTATGQNLNTLVLKKTFSTEEELFKTYPQLIKPKLLLEKGSIKVLDNKNAVKKQVPRSSIPSNLNAFIFSPSGEYFVAYEETEVHTTDLYFYRSDGSFLAKQKIDIYPNIKFSNSGEYVIAFNSFGREIFVFTKNGLLLFFGDYIDLTKNNTQVLYSVLVSENGKEIVINAADDIYLIECVSKKQIFHEKVGRVLDGDFYSKNKVIALRTAFGAPQFHDLKILSKNDGRKLDEITRVASVEFIPASLVVSKDSKIQEYVFK